jgi:hypothetical protein
MNSPHALQSSAMVERMIMSMSLNSRDDDLLDSPCIRGSSRSMVNDNPLFDRDFDQLMEECHWSRNEHEGRSSTANDVIIPNNEVHRRLPTHTTEQAETTQPEREDEWWNMRLITVSSSDDEIDHDGCDSVPACFEGIEVLPMPLASRLYYGVSGYEDMDDSTEWDNRMCTNMKQQTKQIDNLISL